MPASGLLPTAGDQVGEAAHRPPGLGLQGEQHGQPGPLQPAGVQQFVEAGDAVVFEGQADVVHVDADGGLGPRVDGVGAEVSTPLAKNEAALSSMTSA
jgi:hypothetical protein